MLKCVCEHTELFQHSRMIFKEIHVNKRFRDDVEVFFTKIAKTFINFMKNVWKLRRQSFYSVLPQIMCIFYCTDTLTLAKIHTLDIIKIHTLTFLLSFESIYSISNFYFLGTSYLYFFLSESQIYIWVKAVFSYIVIYLRRPKKWKNEQADSYSNDIAMESDLLEKCIAFSR